MATQSPASTNPTTENLQSATEPVKQTNEVQQDGQAEATKQASAPSVFVNSEPMREDQVQNAVKFLSHPKVQGSPVIYRRSFLEKKGLTKEEIDEAFRRVPDPSPNTQLTSGNQDGQAKSSSNNQPQAPTQALPPAAAASAGVAPQAGTLMRSRFHWYHAVIAVGVLAVSGAGTAVLLKNAVLPRLKSWIRRVVLEEENESAKKVGKASLAEEATAAAKAAAAAAADVAKASQEMLDSKIQEKRYFEEFMNLMDVQVKEMKSMSNAIRKLEGQTNESGRPQEDYRVPVTTAKQSYGNGRTDFDMRSVRSSLPPTAAEPSVAPHPKSYMEIMAMIQRGERPSNIKEINDQPPNPNQQLSNPRLAPRTKPWEAGQAQYGSSQVLQSQSSAEGSQFKVQDNGVNYQLDNESSVPWWQRKNVRITEVENEDDLKAGSSVRINEQPPPVQRSWVPPQPPPVAMPGAAEAIRRPKPPVQKEQLAGDQSVANSIEVTDELQRITKISETGGPAEVNGVEEINGGGSVGTSSEIQEEQAISHEGNN